MRNGTAALLILATSVLASVVTVHAGTPTVGAVEARDVSSPVGIWKTVDDKTGKARSLVRIYEKDGKLFARIEQSLVPGDEARTCTKFSDEWGTRLKVRGFLGVSLFGRSQTWERER
jgi:hypothetical protein